MVGAARPAKEAAPGVPGGTRLFPRRRSPVSLHEAGTPVYRAAEAYR